MNSVFRGGGVALCALAASLLGACRAIPSADRLLGVVTPYKVEVVQGNVVTREQAAQVTAGMSRAQVRDILGSPLLQDIFHVDRWDYVFTIRRPGAEPQTRRVTVRFEGDRMASIEAPELPAERDFVASIDTFRAPLRTPALALSDAQMKQLPVPKQAASPAATTPLAPSARSYPPLEAQ